MPGPITHLKVAYIYNKEMGGKFSPQLYLGSICPDSVNVDGHAEKEIRWPAHLRDKDLNVWYQNAKRFYEENITKYDNSYLVGYILHIVTDIAWDMWFDGPLFAEMYKSGVPKEELKETRWAELYGYEKHQSKLPWFSETAVCLKVTTAENIGTVTAFKTEILKSRIINREIPEGREPIFINDGFMTLFFAKTVELASEIFQKSI